MLWIRLIPTSFRPFKSFRRGKWLLMRPKNLAKKNDLQEKNLFIEILVSFLSLAGGVPNSEPFASNPDQAVSV
jgi:hypothetical protein